MGGASQKGGEGSAAGKGVADGGAEREAPTSRAFRRGVACNGVRTMGGSVRLKLRDGSGGSGRIGDGINILGEGLREVVEGSAGG